jgi:hypothetical protein
MDVRLPRKQEGAGSRPVEPPRFCGPEVQRAEHSVGIREVAGSSPARPLRPMLRRADAPCKGVVVG